MKAKSKSPSKPAAKTPARPSALKSNKGAPRAKAISDRYGNVPIR